MFIPFEDGEVIVAKVHRHWIFIAIRLVMLGIFLVAPFFLLPVLERAGFIAITIHGVGALTTIWALWGLIVWAIFWQFWTTYYMDIWVVTNRRIIDIDYQRLFDRNISILRLDRVQDMSTHVKGVWGTLLKYGSVVVQTAGAQDEFVIDQISDPDSLRNIISQQIASR